MTADNFERSLSAVLKHEGGYVDHPRDPGGATNMGITFKVLEAWRGKKITKADVRNLTRKEAAQIYRRQYWTPVRGDDLPAGVDYAVFDFAVNSGVSRAVKFLQAAVGVKVDGHVGAITMEAVDAHDPKKVIADLCDRRLAWLKNLTTFNTFGKGWTRRVSSVKSDALSMVAEGQTGKIAELSETEVIHPTPKSEDRQVKPLATTGGKGLSTAALGLAGSAASEAAAQIRPIADYVPIAQYLFAGLLVIGVGITMYVTWKNLRGEADDEATA